MDLFKLVIRTASELGYKILYAGSSAWGWCISQLVFIVSFFDKDSAMLIKIIWVVVAIDLVLGIITSVKLKRHVFSQAIIKSAIKYGIYTALFWIVVASERGIGLEWFLASKLIFAFSVAAETWSILAHISIIKPDLVIVRLLRKALSGEVAKKLGVSPDEAIAILDGKEAKNG